MKTCPECSARHGDAVITCDCGHDFFPPEAIADMMVANAKQSAGIRVATGIIGIVLGIGATVIAVVSALVPAAADGGDGDGDNDAIPFAFQMLAEGAAKLLAGLRDSIRILRKTIARGGAAQARRQRKRRLALYLLCPLALVVLLPGLLVVQDDLAPADAIVVIGGDHKPARMAQAADLYRAGYAPLVIVSAGKVVQEGDAWMPEAEVMLHQPAAVWMPSSAVVIEDDSQTTAENARYVVQICRELDVESLLLVTSAYHSSRARHVFRREIGDEIAVLAQPAPREHPALLWWAYPDEAAVVFYEAWNWALVLLGLA